MTERPPSSGEPAVQQEAHDAVRYEAKDVPLRPALVFLVGLAVGVAAVVGLMVWLFNVFAGALAEPEPVWPRRVATPPAWRPDPSPVGELERLRHYEDELLFGPPRRRNGFVQIPIDQAIDLVAEQGLAGTIEGAAEPPAEVDGSTDPIPVEEGAMR